jgi:hypothetical protein
MTLNEKLRKKRILFLSVKTFNYEKVIAAELRNTGAVVDYFDERPSNSVFVKGVIRLKKSIYQNEINRYYSNILKKIEGVAYNYFFVIKGEVVPTFFIEKVKLHNPNCQLIYYTWDSFSNNKNSDVILKYFDRVFTFDSDDAKKHNLYFRPLFYLNDYKQIKNSRVVEDLEYDLLFLGTAHSDRYVISNTLVNWCKNNNLKAYAYYYMQAKSVFMFKKFFDKSFKTIDKKKIRFESLNLAEILELYKKTKVILDIHHPNQKGLTMRTFEALGAGKKLITTNAEIKKYRFYNDKNILIIDRDKPMVTIEFFECDSQEMSSDILDSMSIRGWLQALFVDSKPNFWINGLD